MKVQLGAARDDFVYRRRRRVRLEVFAQLLVVGDEMLGDKGGEALLQLLEPQLVLD